jgi:hypothetical protein
VLDQLHQHIGGPFFVGALCPDYYTRTQRRSQQQNPQDRFAVRLLQSVFTQQLDAARELGGAMDEAGGRAGVQAEPVGYGDFAFLQALDYWRRRKNNATKTPA